MAGSVNKVILVGNLGADPEIRRLNSGEPVVNIRIATSESWRDKNSGERKEKTEWHNVVIFNDQIAKVAEQYLKKGMKVYVEGQLQTRKWQDQTGADKYTTEVVLQKFRGELQMLDARGEGGGQVGNYAGGGEQPWFRFRPVEPERKLQPRRRPVAAVPRAAVVAVRRANWTTKSRSELEIVERYLRRGRDVARTASIGAPSHSMARLRGPCRAGHRRRPTGAAERHDAPSRVGYVWAALMLVIAISSFWIQQIRLIGPFSPIHLLSILVLVTVPLAVWHAHMHRVTKHRRVMISLYVFALIGAGVFTLLPGRIMHAVVFGQ